MPLLDDKSRNSADGLTIGQHAANAIARLLEEEDSIERSAPEAEQTERLEQIRWWAEKD